MLNALPAPRHSAVVAAVLLVRAVAAEAPDRPPAGSDYVYAVGEEFTVQTDASLVELAKTAPRENIAAVRRRLASGASVGAQDEMGYTGLHWAAVNGHMEIARLLLNAGANVEAVNDRGATPLFLAAQNGQLAVAELLVDQGRADLDTTHRASRLRPDEVALSSGFEALAEMILARRLDDTDIDTHGSRSSSGGDEL